MSAGLLGCCHFKT